MRKLVPITPTKNPDAKVRCPDCRKWTEQFDACDHCGCPLTNEAAADLMEGLESIAEEILCQK